MKTYLVIGAGPGIGLGTAQKFASEGYRVVLAARSDARLQGAMAALRETGADVSFAQVDASDAQAVTQLVQRFGEELAVLHYNAGVLHYDNDGALQASPLDKLDISALVGETAVNLTSALAAIKAGRDALAKRGGTILVTGGGFGIEPNADFINISVAKAGIRAAVKALSEPFRSLNIHLATVTVSTLVTPNSEKSREIGEAFWSLHKQADSASWDWETIFS
ncbi:SDR family NAD(P)-dependent oxidoreductase [Paraburkholderia bannensis]|uniref:SDR family NAD(P)-dependent oxidoreductase n=1 Tax=Paraburkholderia bannensis TaxID=765414 RepID=UPI002ABDB6F8|nr:SDR family NAD(P)-dependent oxidoreductase [Paraburkholderia bannensis]